MRTCTTIVLHENFLSTADFCYSDIMLSFLFTRGVDSTPPGGLLNFFNKNPPKNGPPLVVINGTSSQLINIGDDTSFDYPRTEKRMLGTKDEDIILISSLNHISTALKHLF